MLLTAMEERRTAVPDLLRSATKIEVTRSENGTNGSVKHESAEVIERTGTQ